MAQPLSPGLRYSCPWRLLPKDLPPWRTAYRWFARLRDDGTWEALNCTLVVGPRGPPDMADREQSGCNASPSAAAPCALRGATRPQAPCAGGYRRATASTAGQPRGAVRATPCRTATHRAYGAMGPLLQASRGLYPFIERAFADGGYAGERVTSATPQRRARCASSRSCASRPVRSALPSSPAAGWSNARSPGSAATAVAPCTPRARDFEAAIASATAFLYAASVMLLT